MVMFTITSVFVTPSVDQWLPFSFLPHFTFYLDEYCAGTIDENASPIQENSWNSNNVHFGYADTSSTLVSFVASITRRWRSLVNSSARDTLQNLVERRIADKQKQKDKKQRDFPTELTISLQYLPPCDETITGKLVIGIEVLSNLLYVYFLGYNEKLSHYYLEGADICFSIFRSIT